MNVERPPIAVESPLRKKRFLSAEEFTYARGRTDRVLKVTLPSPSLFANFWDSDRSTGAYARAGGLPRRGRRDPARRGRRARSSRSHVHPARRPALPVADRSRVSRLLRKPRLARRALARPRARARQPRHRRSPRCHVQLPSLPWKPGEPLARRGRIRLARRAALPQGQRAAAHARVRRRAVRARSSRCERFPRTRSPFSGS